MIWSCELRLEGSILKIFWLFSFSRISFFLWMELPFLKFIKYILTEKSASEKAVKKVWSEHVVDILKFLFESMLSCLSLK